ncbi:unnamed protein product [Fusarium equiseti]|uniref:Crystal protein ET79 n=1 Tax=Fusarium equiseti TaxID=61235 RepID=A0A8J2IWK0_FUSEQ|nr:unnamed protein product [Fusarium equiseti]
MVEVPEEEGFAPLDAPEVEGDDAPRRTTVVLVNNTQQTLTWAGSGCDHGERYVPAPETIAPGASGTWALRSAGFQTGRERWIEWRVGDNGPTVELKYNNPYYGSNSYSCSVDSYSYDIGRDGGDGDYANVTFTLTEN